MRTKHLVGAASALLIGLAAVASPAQAQYYGGVDSGFPAPTGDSAFIPAGSKLMRVFDDGCLLTEGIAAGHDGYMYFSDITFTELCRAESGLYAQAGNIWRYDPKSGEASIFRSPSGMSNGLKFDRDGNMVAALGADHGGRKLIKTDMASDKSYILSATYDGRSYNSLNDLSIDEQGRVYFSDPRYVGHEPVFQPGFAIYRLDTDGTVDRIVTNGGKTNGVLVSPDQKTLFVVSNDNGWFGSLDETDQAPIGGRHLLQAYDLAADGTVSNRRVVIDYAELYPGKPCSGPDGLIADSEGNLYVAERCEHRPGIAVRDANGQELGFISTGEEMPTNVGFGRGDESNVLYVTSGKSLYKIRMAKSGYQLP